MNSNTEATIRRRIRQKLAAIGYIRDKVSNGKPDAPGDRSVLAWVTANHGLGTNDVPTVRELAGLARAAATDDDTLIWALLARRLTKAARPDLAEIQTMTADLIQRRSPLRVATWTGQATLRLARASDRFRSLGSSNPLEGARGFAKDNGILPFLSPCWYLVAFCDERNEEDIVGILKPDESREKQMVRELCRRLIAIHYRTQNLTGLQLGQVGG